MKNRSGPSTSQQQREESYRQWLERKRTQTERQRAEEIMRQYRHKERLEKDKNKRERAKEEKLADWIRRKEEEMKGDDFLFCRFNSFAVLDTVTSIIFNNFFGPPIGNLKTKTAI